MIRMTSRRLDGRIRRSVARSRLEFRNLSPSAASRNSTAGEQVRSILKRRKRLLGAIPQGLAIVISLLGAIFAIVDVMQVLALGTTPRLVGAGVIAFLLAPSP